jgi:hypothetical protein
MMRFGKDEASSDVDCQIVKANDEALAKTR